MTDTDDRPREWPFWLVAIGLWIGGVVAVLGGQEVVGGALVLGAGGVLLILRWRLRRRRRRLDGADDAGDRLSLIDVLDP